MELLADGQILALRLSRIQTLNPDCPPERDRKIARSGREEGSAP
jgi:hypothetical protein